MIMELSFLKALSITMDVLEPGVVFELRMELLFLAAMIGVYRFTTWNTGGKLKQMSKDRLGKPDSHVKYDGGNHSLSDEKSSYGRETGTELTSKQYPRPCMIMDEIMEVGPQNFNRKGKEHGAVKWGQLPPKLSSFFKNGSKFEVDTQALGEILTKGAADRNLQLFDELCGLLNRDGLMIAEIARITKHNALDFYNTMVQSCVKLNKNDKVVEVLTHLAKHSVARNIGFCEGVMKQLAGARWFKEALQVYPILTSGGLEPSTVMCSCMICFAAECGDYELTKQFYSRLRSLATPNLRTCMTILQVHSKQGEWQAALAVYKDMQRSRIQIDSHVLNMVMGTCAAAGMANEVEQLLAEAEADDPELVLADAVSYNIVMKAYAQCGDYPNAAKVLMRMRERGLEPNAITYNSLVDAAARTGEAAAAWEFYQDMVAYGFPGDKYTCSILIKTLLPNPTGDRIRACLDLLQQVGAMCDLKLRTRLYHNVIEAALKLGDSTVLIRAFSQTRQHRVRPNAASFRQLKQLADQCKGSCRNTLENAVHDDTVLGSFFEETQVGNHKASPADHHQDQARTSEVPAKPQALFKPHASQWCPRGSTSDESNWSKHEEVLGVPATGERLRTPPARQWRPRKV